MTDAVNNALLGTITNINEALGSTVGYDTETGTGGIEMSSVVAPPACPIEPVGSGKVVPGVPQPNPDQAPGGSVEPAPDSGGGGTSGRKSPSGGTVEPPAPGQIIGRPYIILPPPPPPTCPIITIKDPCGGYSTHGPGPGGQGSGTPGGTQSPGQGDPGTPGGAPSGGAGGDGQVFQPGGQTIGLGGQNRGIDLGGGLGLSI